MPFVERDPQSCPKYGHICPEFMNDCGLSENELEIRSTIHCVQLIGQVAQGGNSGANAQQMRELVSRLLDAYEVYPVERFPQYYL
jgi:hypothetical protein